jgi:hypothetical protein
MISRKAGLFVNEAVNTEAEAEAEALMPTIAQLKEWGQRVLGTIPVLKAVISNSGDESPATAHTLVTLKSVGEQLVDEGENSAHITSHLDTTAAPVASSLYPTPEPAVGGTIITVKGSGPINVSSVLFGSAAGSDLVLKSDSEFTVKRPPGAPGGSDLMVVTPKGMSEIVPGWRSLTGDSAARRPLDHEHRFRSQCAADPGRALIASLRVKIKSRKHLSRCCS